MASTVSESNAINTVIRYIVGGGNVTEHPTDDDVEAALATLARAAYKTLMAGATPDTVRAAFADTPRPGTARAAVAVAEGLHRHASHNGAIPWPSVRRPYDTWAGTNASA